MSISERARAGIVRDMPEQERPISEEYRLVAKAWVDADAAASLLEETKTALLSKLMLDQGEMPVSKAEMNAKASAQWVEYIDAMVTARAEANLRRVQMKYVEMRYGEWQSKDANARKERHMGRQAT
jgi:hypothetical protein